MTDQEAIDNLNGFTADQEAEFNKGAENKLYTTEGGSLTTAEKNEVDSTVSHINSLSDEDVSENITPSLTNRRLSGRPC